MANVLDQNGKTLFYLGFVSQAVSFRVYLKGTNYSEYKVISLGAGVLNVPRDSIAMLNTPNIAFACPKNANVSYIEIFAEADWEATGNGFKKVASGDLPAPKTFAYSGTYYLEGVTLKIV